MLKTKGKSEREFKETSLYLVFQAKVKVGKHMKARRQQCHLHWDDAQLALLCLARVPPDTNDVPTP